MKKIISFTAEWCPNCPRMKPVLAQLVEDGFDVEIIDVEASPDLAKNWGVQSLPTTLIYKNESGIINIQDRLVGARPYSFMQDLLKD